MRKWIILSERADIGGEIRRPEEGAIAVNVKAANELIKAGKAKAHVVTQKKNSPKKAAPRKAHTATRAAAASKPVESAVPAPPAPDSRPSAE